MIPIYITKERAVELVAACRNAGIPCPELEQVLLDFDEFIEGAVFYKEDVEDHLRDYLDHEPTEEEVARTMAALDPEELNERMAAAGAEMIQDAIYSAIFDLS